MFENPEKQLGQLLRRHRDENVLFCASTPGRRENLAEWLKHQGIEPQRVSSWQSYLQNPPALGLCDNPIEAGFAIPGALIISDRELLDQPASADSAATQSPERETRDLRDVIESLSELSPGSLVVHRQNGIGRYRGLETITHGEASSEYATLEYAESVYVYLPVDELHTLSAFSGPDDTPLDTLGGLRWKRASKRAQERADDVAAELLDIYSKRLRFKAPVITQPAAWDKFCSEFPYTASPDQQSTINAVMQDLTTPNPMDRLVCGDVGFGKTEVAIRAAFAAVQSGYQVALMAPTTLLAHQHYLVFQDRFADWPVSIAEFSASKGSTQAGNPRLIPESVDIAIGTHALLNRDFPKLGLLIVDEEHRFGVAHKEKLRRQLESTHLLALTATPIPRTLNMALSGLRDISIIATSPEHRLPIRTKALRYDKTVVREAIQRELLRGGQVYYVHNRVQTIEGAYDRVAALVPEASIAIAHGQLRRVELERVMRGFYRREYNVLICSSIIESGLDVPTANTIIIENVDRFGLAQMHQMRGRVGRSHHQAYAYFLLPEEQRVSPTALRRIRAVERATEPGSGFILASEDLDIRGSGELLGHKQSGSVADVGLSLFSSMIERAVRRSKGEPEYSGEAVEINLQRPAFIPDNYIADAPLRLKLYRRISAATSPELLRELRAEIADRFSELPDPVRGLFTCALLRLRCLPLRVRRLQFGENGGFAELLNDTPVSPDLLIALVSEQQGAYYLRGNRLHYKISAEDISARETCADKLLSQLENCVCA